MSEINGQYTITLDDDSQVHKIIASITGIPSLPFTSPDKLMGRANSYSPAAVFVDVNLDVGVSGIDYLSRIREIWSFVPLFVITSDDSQHLITKALASGANDFIRKPLIPEEVSARLQMRVTEMREKQGLEEINLNDVIFNSRLGFLRKQDQIVHLSPLESDLLLYLTHHIGMNTTKDAIKQHLWGKTKTCDNALDKKISNLRKAIKDCKGGIEIVTFYGGKVALKYATDKL